MNSVDFSDSKNMFNFFHPVLSELIQAMQPEQE